MKITISTSDSKTKKEYDIPDDSELSKSLLNLIERSNARYKAVQNGKPIDKEKVDFTTSIQPPNND